MDNQSIVKEVDPGILEAFVVDEAMCSAHP
jgi:hypothetical protein